MTQSTAAPALSRLDVHVFRVPLDRPVVTSFGAMRDRPAVFVRLEDADGVFGWGEVFANWPAAGAEHRARLLVEDMGDLLIGQRFAHRSDLFHQLTDRTRIRALQCREWGPFDQVIAGLDTAIHDLMARRSGQSLALFLNPDAPPSVPAYASGIHIRDAAEVIARCREAGHDAFKIKTGFDLPRDIADTLQIAASLAPGERLFADANQGWDADQAIAYLQGLAECPLGWLEEPIIATAAPEAWEHVRRASAVPLAGGENIAGLDAFDHAIAAATFGYLQPDLAKWGGITGCEWVARRALASGATYCPHFLGGGIGLLASAAVLAAVGGRGLLEVDVNPNPLREGFDLFRPRQPRNCLHLPQAPGLGITTLPEALHSFQTLHATLTTSGPRYRSP
ncbi:mandelate racemase/muconate lactonizing enzyme family protein [Antarctobacter heliothermus]|uniref:L-alanine-DL-glutamate epimerase n=1 Tax=Antarctobacter heliothermus TaxID=74033 RepID=A0A239FW13_9RHOB|nr:mandelate racemase/muconate lactonizing enzyme family protein [Antarctobacter heliothermus]SNS60718.1 L-alanine-DL-glutamate epimerase [Antarctobacter heliothermus]